MSSNHWRIQMAEVFDEYADERTKKPAENILQELEAMTHLFREQEAEVAAKEEELKEAVAKRNKTRFTDFPELMKRAGNLTEWKIELPNGKEAVVTRKKEPGGALSKGNREFVLKFMMDNGYAHLISSDIVMSFTAGQKEEYDAAIAKLQSADMNFAEERTVQSSRYSAWCARMVDSSKITPDQFGLFGIHVVEQVKLDVKERKAKRGLAAE